MRKGVKTSSSQLFQKRKEVSIQYSYSRIVSNEKPSNLVDRLYAQRIMGGAFGA
jgi:hypothetical protein